MIKMILTIEGNIGSGKSTLVKQLRTELASKWTFLDEPVDEWLELKDESGKSLIELFYADKKRYSYTFQNYAYITRMRKLMETNKHNINVTERCVLTDKYVFAQMLTDDGYMNQMEDKMYKDWFDIFEKFANIDLVVYIKTDPTICNERIKIRAREGEEIPLDYLERLHEYHEKWINDIDSKKLLVLDGSTNFKDNPDEFIKKIKEFVDQFILKPTDKRDFYDMGHFC